MLLFFKLFLIISGTHHSIIRKFWNFVSFFIFRLLYLFIQYEFLIDLLLEGKIRFFMLDLALNTIIIDWWGLTPGFVYWSLVLINYWFTLSANMWTWFGNLVLMGFKKCRRYGFNRWLDSTNSFKTFFRFFFLYRWEIRGPWLEDLLINTRIIVSEILRLFSILVKHPNILISFIC